MRGIWTIPRPASAQHTTSTRPISTQPQSITIHIQCREAQLIYSRYDPKFSATDRISRMQSASASASPWWCPRNAPPSTDFSTRRNLHAHDRYQSYNAVGRTRMHVTFSRRCNRCRPLICSQYRHRAQQCWQSQYWAPACVRYCLPLLPRPLAFLSFSTSGSLSSPIVKYHVSINLFPHNHTVKR
jgi:hypothetical protein